MKVENKTQIGNLVKKYIKLRNKTIYEVADAMGIKYTTFSAQLINDTLTADMMFKLAAYLDIDLEWMIYVLGYTGKVSSLESEMALRIRDKNFRAYEKEKVLRRLDIISKENLGNTSLVRRELLKEFHNNMFYLLDVLIPEDYDIHIIQERNKLSYFVDTHEVLKLGRNSFSTRRANLITGIDALSIVIEERKEEL